MLLIGLYETLQEEFLKMNTRIHVKCVIMIAWI